MNENPHEAFILGCERSGSTWLSNIIDACPDVEFFMEPFARQNEVFPGFPDRNFYLETCGDHLLEYVKSEWGNLPKMKYIFYKRGSNDLFGIMDGLMIRFYTFAAKLLKFRVPRRITRAVELNLNKKEFNLFQPNHKSKKPRIRVVKELRLNFKVGVLSKIFPDAKYLITIRHPGAQISSVVKLLAEGHLVELHQSLISLPEYINAIPRFEKYIGLIDGHQWGEDLEHMLVVWWLINYDTLINDCKRFNVEFIVLYHEGLSQNMHVVSRDVFEFLGINYSSRVQAYVNSSSTRKHPVKSPVDTNRDTINYYKEQINKVNPLLMQKIMDGFASIAVEEELLVYGSQDN